ncbi:hypothetical protein [Streptomyces sp. NPDC058412]|uniref:terpene synthase family protein n=1 Tax=Streptomyces sp. NPDC058412 TaxID=3346486 RepID=UPI00365A770E
MWRQRLTARLPNVFDDVLWEVDNLAFGRISDPVEYIGMRRRADGALWAAQLVERALGLDLPPVVREQPAPGRLHEAFDDTASPQASDGRDTARCLQGLKDWARRRLRLARAHRPLPARGLAAQTPPPHRGAGPPRPRDRLRPRVRT